MVAIERVFEMWRSMNPFQGRAHSTNPIEIEVGQQRRRPMTSVDFNARWPRFSMRLSTALERDGGELRRQGIRLRIADSVCSQEEAGTVLNAAVTLVRNGVRESSVAALHVTQLPERGSERSLAGLAHQLTAAAATSLQAAVSLQKVPPLAVLPVFSVS